MSILLLLLLATLLPIRAATIYYVTAESDDANHDNQQNITIHTLEYYINSANKYLNSHTYLYFLPGQHYLYTVFFINSTTNFTVAGNDSTIVCTPPASVRVVNATNFKLVNINLFNCGSNNYYYLDERYPNFTHSNFNFMPTELLKLNISILLDHCTSVTIKSVHVSVKVGFTGLFAINMKNTSYITDFKVDINCSICPKFYSHISGIILHYSKINHTDNNDKHDTNTNLLNYQYKTYGSCSYNFQYAITLLLFQKHYNISINIQRMGFNYLKNSSLLYYFGEVSKCDAVNRVTFNDSVMHHNTGNSHLTMFHIVLNNKREIINDFSTLGYSQQCNIIDLENCIFANNANMKAIIYLTPASSRIIAGNITIRNVTFCYNSQTHFIKIKSTAEIIWHLTTSIQLCNVEIISNKHNDGDSLISVTNGVIYFVGPFQCMNNSYYRSIVELHLSVAVSRGQNINFTNNIVRQIMEGKSGSYFMMEELSVVDISMNTVYTVVKQVLTFGSDSWPICPIQFHSIRGNIDKDQSIRIENLYQALMVDNVQMLPQYLPGFNKSFGNCTWLAGTAFYEKSPKSVYDKVFQITSILTNRTTKRLIPLSICPCINSTVYDCYSDDLEPIFPGQTININLLVQEKWLTHYNPSTTLMVANTPDDNCSVTDSNQLSQTYTNHGCNKYRYTISPSNKHTNVCKLFLDIIEMSEMFYIEIKPCPQGFTLNKDSKACQCDPLLDNKILSITSCDLDDQTILRPANSWISADTVNGLHTYLVSSACPFDYCLPYSSHHKLSDPNSQCQYNRTGVLCGQCKQGLSRVFGSSQCRYCSNIYLLLIIPILIVGIVLVMMLFIFQLTITNGIINSFIFYFSIVCINHEIFFPSCQSIICSVVRFINLDFGAEICFYNGMDDYAIAWLLLAFPTYLIIIAIFLIVITRYSNTIQRITAKKALPVLATLFLLSYTKILQNVCNVLFQYFELIYLPSNHTKVVWSISTTTPLFGLKFLVIFTVCFVFFLILLSFNVILLFTRTLLRFNFIAGFKPLLDVYFGPYKDRAYYWTGLMLLARTVIFALSAFNEYVSLIAISVLLGGLLWWHGVVKPFRSKYDNFQESGLILNLLVVHTIPLYNINELGLKIAQIIIALAVGYFALIILFYCCIFKFSNTIQTNIKKLHNTIWGMKVRTHGNNQDATEMEELRSRIPEVTYNCREFREPLVEFD